METVVLMTVVPLSGDPIRAQFESWYSTLPGYSSFHLSRRIEVPEEYAISQVQSAWTGWLASCWFYMNEVNDDSNQDSESLALGNLPAT